MKNYETGNPTREKFCLNGLWDFARGENGISVLPSEDEWESVKIKVPSPYNVNSFTSSHYRETSDDKIWVQGGDFRLYPEYPASWDKAKCGFYRRKIFIGSELRGKRIFLRYDGVAFHAKHYINGTEIAETMEAFLPLELEITDNVVYGAENEVVAACETAGYLMYKGKDGRNRLDYPRGSFWGEHIAGIWQDAWLIVRNREYVDDVYAVSDVYTRELRVRYSSETEADSGCNVKIFVRKWGESGEYREIAQGLPVNGEYTWHWQDGEIELWDFRQPNLYELCVSLCRDDEVLDEKITRIGFRTMRADGEKFVLNGRRINLKIDAWHYMGYSIQTPEYARAYYKMAFDAGVNIIRLHAEPFPEFFIDIADEMGMMIVSESAVWASHCSFSYSPDFFKNSEEHLVRMLKRDRNHPSVVMWSPENECIPAYMFCGSDYVKSIPELEEKIYDFLKVTYDYDDSRLISCDGSGDLGGRLPVNSLHYPHYDCPTHRGKPITIGEMGSMYYSNADAVTQEFGKRGMESFNGRLESVGEEAYNDLIGERKWASQICVFNLIWYGLEPMPFNDRMITYPDEAYETPGIKPSRITKYLRTLNAGEDKRLPQYIPNPVWRKTRDAYIPVRSFAERVPEYIWTGEEHSFFVSTFNDSREDGVFTLSAFLSGEKISAKLEKTLTIASCEYSEDTLEFDIPEYADGGYVLKLTLSQNGHDIHTCTYSVTALRRAKLDEEFAATGVCLLSKEGDEAPENTPVIELRKTSPYSDFTKTRTQKRFFDADFSVAYAEAVETGVFEDCLNFSAIPALTDGRGAAVALDLTCAGEKRIVCALNLDDGSAESAVIKLHLAKRLAAEEPAVTAKPYLLGDGASETAAMLTELGCEFDLITRDDLYSMLDKKHERLLIIDGSSDFDSYELFSSDNFSRVLVSLPTFIPRIFAHEMKLENKKRFHTIPKNGADSVFGLNSNAVYGCEINRECPIAAKTIVHLDNARDILYGVPNIDWRAWNNIGEAIKTVAVHRTEKCDNSRLSAFSVKHRAGCDIYFSTFSAEIDSPKLKNIYARILSRFSVPMEIRRNDELENIMSAGMYKKSLARMLVCENRDGVNPADALPGLNKPQNGSMWTIANSGNEYENALYGVYITSPQDRRDLLINPDFIDLHVKAEANTEVFLNGEKLGEGNELTVTGIPLLNGENRFTVSVNGKCRMPEITFVRVKKSVLDLKFSLLSGELKKLPMKDVKYYANVNDVYSSHASFTRDHFWSTVENQQSGMYIDITMPDEITLRALWFYAIKFHEEGGDHTPRAFKLYSVENGEAQLIYSSLNEKAMSYPRGRVFCELEKPQKLTTLRFEITESAPKEFVMADLALFS